MDGMRVIKIGNPGAPDILGIVNGSLMAGCLLAIECKTGEAVQSKEQKSWQKMIESYGGIYIVARELEDVLSYFRDWIL